MSSLLVRRFSFSIISFPRRHHLFYLLTPLLRFYLSSSTKTQPQKESPFLTEYLITSFGISPDRALKISTSKYFRGIKSSDGPEAVVQFLRDTGLSDAQIKATISRAPILLRYNAEKSLKPNARELMAQGFSAEMLAQLIQYEPISLGLTKTPSRLLFWKDIFGIDNETLLKFIKRNRYLITFDIDKGIVPRMNFLKECGLSNQDIASMVGSSHNCFRRSLDHLRQIIDMIENIGIQRESGMFLYALKALGNFSIETIQRKTRFFQTAYGWSEQETCLAFRGLPHILIYSEEKVKSAMDFLINEVKLHPSSIASVPKLLGYSLEKRLVPRHRVLSILHAKKLKERCKMSSACSVSERAFLEKYVKPYEKVAPELSDVYFASLGLKVPA